MQVWAFSNLGINPGREVMDALAAASVRIISEFVAQNISNTLWAFAKMEHPHRELFAAAGAHAARIMSSFTPQAVANMLWAYATAGLEPGAEVLQAAWALPPILAIHAATQWLSAIAWRWAVGVPAPGLGRWRQQTDRNSCLTSI